jgi:hypothetical protein
MVQSDLVSFHVDAQSGAVRSGSRVVQYSSSSSSSHSFSSSSSHSHSVGDAAAWPDRRSRAASVFLPPSYAALEHALSLDSSLHPFASPILSASSSSSTDVDRRTPALLLTLGGAVAADRCAPSMACLSLTLRAQTLAEWDAMRCADEHDVSAAAATAAAAARAKAAAAAAHAAALAAAEVEAQAAREREFAHAQMQAQARAQAEARAAVAQITADVAAMEVTASAAAAVHDEAARILGMNRIAHGRFQSSLTSLTLF